MINVTKPYLPPLDELLPYLEAMWDSRVLSNNGPVHVQLEKELESVVGTGKVSLFCNATIALITAQQALGLKGEIITTPYSFVATTHAIRWMGNTPVFVDIDPNTMCLDPDLIEAAISDETVAIMPLHCYGNTCEAEQIAQIAERNSLKVIYDACHSFGIEDDGGSVLRHGDISVVSFHATKVFNTFEGGMLVTNCEETKQKVDHLKNFGFVDETVVIESGINGKMSEFSAALGLAQLPHFSEVCQLRGTLDAKYRSRLVKIKGIECLNPVRQTIRNFSYLPIFVTDEYEISRDQLFDVLRSKGVRARRYFYPLISEFEMYSGIPTAATANLPHATELSRQVICLPLYPELTVEQLEMITSIIERPD